MVNDPDAIWKPGYDGPSPMIEAPAEQADDHPQDDVERTDPTEHRSHGRRFGVGPVVALAVTLGLVLVAAVVVLDRRDAGSAVDRPDPSVFGGPAARRLPSVAAPLWSVDVDLGHDGEHRVDVVGRDLVTVTVPVADANPDANPVADPDADPDADPGADPEPDADRGTTVLALDALTGEERWSVRRPGRPHDVTVVGTVDDVLVLEHRDGNTTTVTGVDRASGETRWTTAAEPGIDHLGLVGTPFVAQLPSSSDRSVSLIDAVSGREIGTIPGDSPATALRGWSTDRRGIWYVVDDGVLVGYDLSVELGEPTVIGSVDDVSRPRIVLDDRLVLVDASGSITVDGNDAGGPVTVSEELPTAVRSLTSTSGSNFVITAPRSIAGVSVEDDIASLTWSRNDGEVVDEHPVDDGTLLLVATRGGASLQLVDGLTGETIEHLTMTPGALQALAVAGDGFVALRASGFGAKLAGFDLDGTERWSIAGTTPVVVGDRVVVRATPTDVSGDESATPTRRLRITAYGDVD